MNDYRAIETHIRRAHLQRSAALGEAIAEGIVRAWKRIDGAVKALATLAQAPKEYSTSLPRRF